MDFNLIMRSIAIDALPVLFAITLHEAAHAYAALYFGDDTAWKMGRVTLNPMNHIDPMGTILMPLLLYFASSGALLFGYAKPVPVRFGRLRKPKRDMVWVALAGPAANLLQALLWGAALYLLQAVGVSEEFFLGMCEFGVTINVVMFAFNLFPLPPLDGGRIVVGLLPPRQALAFAQTERYGFFIVMALVFSGIANRLWLQPVMSLTLHVLALLLAPLAALVR